MTAGAAGGGRAGHDPASIDPSAAERTRTDGDGVDLTLIRWSLRMTPSQRLDVLQGFVDSVFELRRGQPA